MIYVDTNLRMSYLIMKWMWCMRFFLRTFLEILDKHALLKKKYLRGNHATLIIKKVRKAITIRSKLRNKFLKDKN